MLWVQHVLKFDESPKFRMWYTVAPGPAGWYEWKAGESIRFACSYAVSEDGMNWKRPNVDLYKPGRCTQRNVILPYGMMHGLFYEPWEPDPKKRFKALICMEGFKSRDGDLIKDQVTVPEGYYLHWSADGIHWEGDLSHYVLPSLRSADCLTAARGSVWSDHEVGIGVRASGGSGCGDVRLRSRHGGKLVQQVEGGFGDTAPQPNTRDSQLQ